MPAPRAPTARAARPAQVALRKRAKQAEQTEQTARTKQAKRAAQVARPALLALAAQQALWFPPAHAARMALFGRKEQATLRIVGMHCGNCQKSVGDALRGVPGVASANVDLVFHRATVSFDPQRVDVARLVEAVRGAGYDASPA